MKRKLKVLIIPSWYPTKENPIWGNYFIEQARTLNEYADVSMLRINRVGLKNINTLFEERKTDGLIKKLYSFNFYKHTILNLKSINLGLSFFLYKKSAYKAYKRYIKIIGKPDIILAQSVLPAGLAAKYISEKENIPFVVHAHSVNVMENKAYKKYVKDIIDSADSYFSVSEVIKSEIKLYGREQCKIIPNFIDTKEFNITKTKSKETFKLINICNFFKVKALEILLEAMNIIVYKKKITNIKLTIVGTGEYEEYYKNISKELKLDNYVTFTGYIPNKNLPEVISKSDVVCISSRNETFGIPLIEGMACGLPCISTDCGGPSEIINDKTGLLVPVDDPKNYAEAIIKMYKEYGNYDKKYIKKYVYEKYDKESVCKNIIDSFNDIIDKRNKYGKNKVSNKKNI